MNLQRWLLQRKPDWVNLENILNKIDSSGIKALKSSEILTLGSLYRCASADLSRARVNNASEQIIAYLNNLTLRAHNNIYKLSSFKLSNIWDFIVYDFPCAFRETFAEFVLAFGIFVFAAVLAMLTVHSDPSNTSDYFVPPNVIQSLRQGNFWTDDLTSNPLISSQVMINNIRIALSALSFGMILGIGSLFIMFYNGFVIGGSIQVVAENGLLIKILTFISAHGVIELTTVFIAGAAGLIMGWALVNPGEYKRWDAVKLKAKIASKLAMGCVLLLIIAGTIEGLISPNQHIPAYIKFLIALLSAILLIIYFFFVGRNRKLENG